MKIFNWNCNLNLSKKFEYIEKHQPDIAIIQECEKLNPTYFPNAEYFWIGKNEFKGLGVIVFNQSARIDSSYNENLIYFLPIQTDIVSIMGVWAYNHRAAPRFGGTFKGGVSDALMHYEKWLIQNDKIIFSGDFNNSVIWDEGNNENNFKNINTKLNKLDFVSGYHHLNKETFGKETKGTLFQYRHRDKPYFIDYIYSKGLKINNITLGDYDEWISHSDHVPLIAEFI